MLRLSCSLISAACALFSVSIADDGKPVGVGPFHLGMSLDDARKAAPDAQWNDIRTAEFSGRVLEIEGEDALDIAGRKFRVRVSADYYRSTIEIEGDLGASDALACEEASFDWLIAIEKGVGPLAPGGPLNLPGEWGPISWAVTRSAEGVIGVAPARGARSWGGRRIGELYSFGESSSALMIANDARGRVTPRKSFDKRPPQSFELSANRLENTLDIAAYTAFEAFETGGACAARLTLLKQTPWPAPEAFEANAQNWKTDLTVGERRTMALAARLTLPDARTLAFDCTLDRRTARALVCYHDGNGEADPQIVALARHHAEASVFDLSGVDRDDPQQMTARVDVRLDPADWKPVDFLDKTRTSLSSLPVVARPTQNDLSTVFPPAAMEGAVGKGARAIATCEVQGDGSLFCPTARIHPDDAAGEHASAFERAARNAAALFRFRTTLSDGSPSQGAVVDIPVDFRIEE